MWTRETCVIVVCTLGWYATSFATDSLNKEVYILYIYIYNIIYIYIYIYIICIIFDIYIFFLFLPFIYIHFLINKKIQKVELMPVTITMLQTGAASIVTSILIYLFRVKVSGSIGLEEVSNTFLIYIFNVYVLIYLIKSIS